MSLTYRNVRSLSLLAWAFLGAGCNDSVTCIFTTGCQGGAGALSDNSALLPIDGEWIVDGRPSIQASFPSGLQNPGTTPVVMVFSESMQPDSLTDAIEVVPLIAGGLPGQPVAGLTQALFSDGRVFVLLPPAVAPFAPGDYLIRLAPDSVPIDLTGQELDLDPGARIASFSVPTTPSAAPRLVATYPAQGATNQSAITEIVAVFDRPVVASSVTAASFDVRVGGSDPSEDPPAMPLAVQGGTDTRVYLYRSVDDEGMAVPLGESASVELRLSPASQPIREADNDVLAPATITFTTLPFSPPRSASLLSSPADAIGLANLTPGNPEELMLEVILESAQANDDIDLVLFGTARSSEPDPPLIAVARSVVLSGAAPILSASFTRQDIPLQVTDAPSDVRFADGPVTFAFRQRRGSVVSPVRLLDLDPDPALIQDPILDITLPTVASLVGSSGTAIFRSDQRGLSLAGTASEDLRAVEVTTPLGNNGAAAPVLGSESKVFLAAPVDLGLLAGGTTTYSFIARDAALNATATASGAFTQLGAVGPGGFVPGQNLDVEVYDALTLQPLEAARVIVHSDQGNGTFPFVIAQPTGSDGHATVATLGAPSVAAIVTVAKAGYDLFTLHGVPSVRLSVPLERSNTARARVSGSIFTDDPAAVAILAGLDRRYDDSRRALELPRGFTGLACSGGASLSCGYGPESIRPQRLGAISFFAGDFTQSEASFSVVQLLQAFHLSIPLAPVAVNASQVADLEVEFLLSTPGAPPEEAPLAVPAFDVRVDPASGVDFLALEDDPSTTGAPFVTTETLVPGVAGSVAVAQGLSYDRGGGVWTVRSAYPGTLSAAGSLGSIGAVDSDPFVRVEVADVDGNAAGVRPRLGAIVAAAPAPEFRALAVPAVLAPAAKASTGGRAFELRLAHSIGDERGMNGLYRVDLQDDLGRRWTLWRLDPTGSADVVLRVVDPADGGESGLDDGVVVAQASAYAWSSLTPTSFLWSDVEREFELFARAAPLSFVFP